MPSLLDSTTQLTLQTPAGNFQVWDEAHGEPDGSGSVREVYSRTWDESKASWKLLCNWTDRFQIARALLGGAQIVGGNPEYTLPATSPVSQNFFAKRIEVSGVGVPFYDTSLPNGGMIGFTYARMNVEYGLPDWAPTTQMAGELELDYSTTNVSLGKSTPAFKYGTGGNPVDPAQMPSLRVTTILASLTLYQRPQLSQDTISSLLDHTNNATFQSWGAGQVCFRGAKSHRRVNIDGSLQWDLRMLFEVCSGVQASWNNVYQPGVGWSAITDLSGTAPFPQADFTPLLI